ncbi:8764_t:CDS:2 [Rhizophagus irregularis]|nr:8764_t:CDS:2 [Rhizophagus irregularis]
MTWRSDIRVVVGLDFGTTYSGFSYYHCEDKDVGCIKVNHEWPENTGLGILKTNTVLQYKDGFEEVELWGHPALCKKPNTKGKDNETRPIELFKLYLGNCLDKHKPVLPEPLNYKKVITDYLHEIGKFMENVLLIATVPAEYSESDKAIMRECIFNAGLIGDIHSEKLQFTTEPEAAAIYCMHSSLKEHELAKPGTNFMVVDCGGGTVDLTTRKLLEENQLGEITERAGDFCGSTFIDKEFIELLKREVGNSAVNSFINEHYGQLQYLVQNFCQDVKLKFTGDDLNCKYELDLEALAPKLLPYITGSERDSMLIEEWMIVLDYKIVKSMFDPIIDRIIKMIRVQLNNSEKCSAIFLVGGFGQSKYLQKRVEEEFSDLVENISIPNQPIAAVLRGAAIYGKSLQESKNMKNMNNLKCVIATRVLTYTFGIRISPLWEYGDPIDRRKSDGRIHKFYCIAERKTIVTIDQEFKVEDLIPIYSDQTRMSFDIYYTKEDTIYCDDDEPGMKLLGKLLIDLPDVELENKRPCSFSLSFGDMEIKARAFNQVNGQNYHTKFELNVLNELDGS